MLDEDPALSKLLAVAAADTEPSGLDIETALRRAWAADRSVARWVAPDDASVHGLEADVAPDGRRFAATGGVFTAPGRDLLVVNSADGTTAWTYRAPTPGSVVRGGRYTPDGTRVVAGVSWVPGPNDRTTGPPPDAMGILVMDADTGRLIRRLDTGPCGAQLSAVADHVALAWVEQDVHDAVPGCFAHDVPGQLEAIDLDTGRRTRLTDDTLGDHAVSRDGRRAAYTDLSDDDRVIVMDLAAGRQVLRLDRETVDQQNKYVRDLSPDGTLMLYGDRPLKVIDVATGREVSTLDSGEGEHFGAAFGPDGTVYASGRDATLSAWDATTGEAPVPGPAAGGGRPSATEDGRILVGDFTTDTATLLEPRDTSQRGSVATCRGFAPAGQLAVAGDTVAFTVACEDGPPLRYVIDRSTLEVVARWPGGDGQASPCPRTARSWPVRLLRMTSWDPSRCTRRLAAEPSR